MRHWVFQLIVLTMLCAIFPSSLRAQDPKPSPLSEAEKRQILMQLYELQASRGIIATYEDFIKRDKEQDAKERENYERAIALEKQAGALIQKELELEKEKARMYQDLYDACKNKPGGAGCFFKRLFSLGLIRC